MPRLRLKSVTAPADQCALVLSYNPDYDRFELSASVNQLRELAADLRCTQDRLGCRALPVICSKGRAKSGVFPANLGPALLVVVPFSELALYRKHLGESRWLIALPPHTGLRGIAWARSCAKAATDIIYSKLNVEFVAMLDDDLYWRDGDSKNIPADQGLRALLRIICDDDNIDAIAASPARNKRWRNADAKSYTHSRSIRLQQAVVYRSAAALGKTYMPRTHRTLSHDVWKEIIHTISMYATKAQQARALAYRRRFMIGEDYRFAEQFIDPELGPNGYWSRAWLSLRVFVADKPSLVSQAGTAGNYDSSSWSNDVSDITDSE